MAERKPRRIQRELTKKEAELLRSRRQQVDQELQDLRERARQVELEKRNTAMTEPTVSGQLRRDISDRGMNHTELAGKVGVSANMIAEFLVGARPLDSWTIDKIAALLKQELKPIG